MTSRTTSGLSSSTTYFIQVRAYDQAGVLGGPAEASRSTGSAPTVLPRVSFSLSVGAGAPHVRPDDTRVYGVYAQASSSIPGFSFSPRSTRVTVPAGQTRRVSMCVTGRAPGYRSHTICRSITVG